MLSIQKLYGCHLHTVWIMQPTLASVFSRFDVCIIVQNIVVNRCLCVSSKHIYNIYNVSGIEFKDFILGFRQSNFLSTTLKCIEKFRIPFIKSGIPASNLGSSEARNPAKFAACIYNMDVAGIVIHP